MPSTPAKNGAVQILSREMSVDRSLPSPTARLMVKQADHSQVTAEPAENGISSDVEDLAFLRLPEVKEMTGLSKSCLYVLIRENNFPAPVKIGNRAVAWVRSEVRDWALGRIAAPR